MTKPLVQLLLNLGLVKRHQISGTGVTRSLLLDVRAWTTPQDFLDSFDDCTFGTRHTELKLLSEMVINDSNGRLMLRLTFVDELTTLAFHAWFVKPAEDHHTRASQSKRGSSPPPRLNASEARSIRA